MRFPKIFARARFAPFLAACLLAAPAHSAEGVPDLAHVLVVIMENHSYDQTRVLPYTSGLLAEASSFAYSYAITHPSQPNYLALWGASTLAVTNDVCPSPGSPYTTENLGHACEAAGLTWKAYSEALPAVGSPICTYASSSYTRKHDPWTNWNNLDHSNEVPFEQFAIDTAADSLPTLAFVIPNNCDNTHNCTPATGDTWLAANLPGMIHAVGPNGLVILTWDEDDSGHGNHILTVFAGLRVKPGYVSPRYINHYSVVRTICAVLGLPSFANAATDSAVTDVWNYEPASVPPSPAMTLRLEAPAPDPTRGEVRAMLHLPSPMSVEAAIYDTGGRHVRTIASGTRTGTIALAWDGQDAAGRDAGSGVFFLRVHAGAQDVTRRLVRVR